MNLKQQKSPWINQTSSLPIPPEPCTSRKSTPAEALKLGIKLPWEGKVQTMEIDDLTKELFIELENYGLTRQEIMHLFHSYNNKFMPMLREWGIPKGFTGVQNKAARDANMERQPGENPWGTKPGQTQAQYRNKPIEIKSYHDTEAGRAKAAAEEDEPVETLTEAKMDAELERVESMLAKINPSELAVPGDINDPPSDIITEDSTGLTYDERHFLGIDGPHEPTQTEKEEMFDKPCECQFKNLPEPDLKFYARELVDALLLRDSVNERIRYCAEQIQKLANAG